MFDATLAQMDKIRDGRNRVTPDSDKAAAAKAAAAKAAADEAAAAKAAADEAAAAKAAADEAAAYTKSSTVVHRLSSLLWRPSVDKKPKMNMRSTTESPPAVTPSDLSVTMSEQEKHALELQKQQVRESLNNKLARLPSGNGHSSCCIQDVLLVALLVFAAFKMFDINCLPDWLTQSAAYVYLCVALAFWVVICFNPMPPSVFLELFVVLLLVGASYSLDDKTINSQTTQVYIYLSVALTQILSAFVVSVQATRSQAPEACIKALDTQSKDMTALFYSLQGGISLSHVCLQCVNALTAIGRNFFAMQANAAVATVEVTTTAASPITTPFLALIGGCATATTTMIGGYALAAATSHPVVSALGVIGLAGSGVYYSLTSKESEGDGVQESLFDNLSWYRPDRIFFWSCSTMFTYAAMAMMLALTLLALYYGVKFRMALRRAMEETPKECTDEQQRRKLSSMIDSHQFVQWVGVVIVILLACFLLATPTPTAEVQLHTVRQENNDLLQNLADEKGSMENLQKQLEVSEAQLHQIQENNENLTTENNRLTRNALLPAVKSGKLAKLQNELMGAQQSLKMCNSGSPSLGDQSNKTATVVASVQEWYKARRSHLTTKVMASDIKGLLPVLQNSFKEAHDNNLKHVTKTGTDLTKAVESVHSIILAEQDGQNGTACERLASGDCPPLTEALQEAVNALELVGYAVDKFYLQPMGTKVIQDYNSVTDTQDDVNSIAKFFIGNALSPTTTTTDAINGSMLLSYTEDSSFELWQAMELFCNSKFLPKATSCVKEFSKPWFVWWTTPRFSDPDGNLLDMVQSVNASLNTLCQRRSKILDFNVFLQTELAVDVANAQLSPQEQSIVSARHLPPQVVNSILERVVTQPDFQHAADQVEKGSAEPLIALIDNVTAAGNLLQ